MSGTERHKLAIGLVVHNGERYLAEAIDSILAQTFTDFELILSDNASTDQTQAICRHYAKADSRVRYIRHKRNLGVSANFNAAFAASNSTYFRWAAYDDVMAPTYLERCIERLDADPTLAGCHSLTRITDAEGKVQQLAPEATSVQSPVPHDRYVAVMTNREYIMWAIMRSDCIAQARPHPPYPSTEFSFQAEMVLQGRFGIVPEYLFDQRMHEECYTYSVDDRTPEQMRQWWGESRIKMPMLYVLVGYYNEMTAIWRSPLPWDQKIACWRSFLRWHRIGHKIAGDVVVIGRRNGKRLSNAAGAVTRRTMSRLRINQMEKGQHESFAK